ncbi:MAG TPA: DUF4114 domain-containing protein [Emcibacteraceae bacterium]|nr:DUF4114 domain-containing protein [Emcibacteraceae bacterium]
MGNSTNNIGAGATSNEGGLLEASYSSHSSSDVYSSQVLEEHLFDSDTIFPELSEYEKLKITQAIDQQELSFSREALATLKIVETGGSFRNVVGHYDIDPNGTIRDVSIAFTNTRAVESGLSHVFNINGSGGSINFFMIANGYSLNKQFADIDKDDHGAFSFVYHHGQNDARPANISDHAADISLIYQAGNGEISTIRGPVYHAAGTGDHNHLNPDGNIHAISGVAEATSHQALRIGFEDFPGLGDADYNDVVFDLSVSYLHPSNPDTASLNDIIPSSGSAGRKEDGNEIPNSDSQNSGDETDHDQDGYSSQSGHGDGPIGLNGGQSAPPPSEGGQNGDGESEFTKYLTAQVNNLLPDLYGTVKTALYEAYGESMYDNYNQLFAQYMEQNYSHIYDEIKTDFYGMDVADGSIDDGFVFAVGVIDDFDHNVISVADQVDESISNFIHIGAQSDMLFGVGGFETTYEVSGLSETQQLEDISQIANTDTFL